MVVNNARIRISTVSLIVCTILCLLVISVDVSNALGSLDSSGGISEEPLVGGPFSFTFSVENTGTIFFNDRLYNMSAEVILPEGITLLACTSAPSALSAGPGNTTIVEFNNIKNLEVNEVLTVECDAEMDATIIPVGDTADILYRWEGNEFPDESGTWVCEPGGANGTNECPIAPVNANDYNTITVEPQPFDLEKIPNPNTGQYQVEGAAFPDFTGNPGRQTNEDWPFTYTLTLLNNPDTAINDIVVIDTIPPGVAYLGGVGYPGADMLTCSAHGNAINPIPNAVLVTTGPDIGSINLTWNLDTAYGGNFVFAPNELCTFTYRTAIPYRYRTASGPIYGGGDGAADPDASFDGGIIPHAADHQNRYNATGIYQGNSYGDGSTTTPDDDPIQHVASGYHSIAKSNDNGDVVQDERVRFTIHGWIAEYYNFTPSVGHTVHHH
jgi:hypothetical protein